MAEIKKPETVPELLDVIDTFLAERIKHVLEPSTAVTWLDQETSRHTVRRACSLLSVLRGPDSDDNTQKRNTTARLRALILPKATKAGMNGVVWDTNDDGLAVTFDHATEPIQYHFQDHVQQAVRDLAALKMAEFDGSKK